MMSTIIEEDISHFIIFYGAGTEVTLFLFGDAYDSFYKESEGSVIAVLDAKVSFYQSWASSEHCQNRTFYIHTMAESCTFSVLCCQAQIRYKIATS